MEKPPRIEISSRTIVFTIVFLLFLKLLWMVRDLIFSLFIAFIVMSAIKPVVVFFERKKIKRTLAAPFVFILSLLLFGYILYWIIPPLIIETGTFLKTLPLFINKLNIVPPNLINQGSFNQYLPDITNQILGFIKNVFSNTVFILSTVFFSFYFVLEEGFIKKFLLRFFEEKKSYQIAAIFEKAEERMQAWVWGELLLMLVVGAMTFIGLILIGVKQPLPLAVIAGLLEIIPNLGPIAATVPAFFVAATQSFFLAVSAIGLYIIVQQLENHLIVPLVMRKTVGLNPIITLMVLIIGGKIGGVLGVLLAIPITLFIETVLIEILKNRVTQE